MFNKFRKWREERRTTYYCDLCGWYEKHTDLKNAIKAHRKYNKSFGYMCLGEVSPAKQQLPGWVKALA